jgi:hypothetical protein
MHEAVAFTAADRVTVDGPAGPEPGVNFTYTFGATGTRNGLPAYELPSGSPRGGNSVTASAVLPKSIADQLQAAVRADPAMVRAVAERLVLENGGLDPAAWDGTAPTVDRPMRPPYEQMPATEPIHLVTDGPDGKLVSEKLTLKPSERTDLPALVATFTGPGRRGTTPSADVTAARPQSTTSRPPQSHQLG